MPARAENAARPISTPEERAALRAELVAFRKAERSRNVRNVRVPTDDDVEYASSVVAAACKRLLTDPGMIRSGAQSGRAPITRAVCCAVLRSKGWPLDFTGALLSMSKDGVRRCVRRCEGDPELAELVREVVGELEGNG